MKVIAIPGNSKKSNEEWVVDLREGLVSCFENVEAIHYDHWKSNGEMDFEDEKEKVRRILENFGGDYVVIAKSIGIVVAMKLIKERKATPKYCIFAGCPIDEEGDVTELERNLEGYSIPTSFIQNSDERFIKPEQLEKKLEELGVKNFRVISGKGEEHAYTVQEIVEASQRMNQKYAIS
ncbi:MAG: hypothetical protein CMH63_02995 [Nanoarchaeota archaeon]|jgi:hypothetical protein|nr:hypothetical protein [Nanoarchaeota archaeon]|tara:strand:+ start:20311 stop:20847 length:537 start_codon:yes stop_codon:yes gene_type:complete